jgi:GTP pyrophosphokinase/guanosine-3',5'-bis(diphosphate) 3'-pyrophosphohydrolase
MDYITVVSALLHDVLEDTDASYEDIKKMFGREVADIVEGVTKIGKIKFRRVQEAQAENYRKLLLAMSKDIRVIIVKLADRLHNMRTLKFLRKDKRVRIAKETMEIFAPIAHRLGIWSIKTELEDIAFMHLYPKEYKRVKEFISESRDKLREYIKKFVIPAVNEILKSHSIEATIQYRSKHLYSVWQKTIRKNINLEDVHDILGVRIIVKDTPTCYTVLGLIHSVFKPVPGKFKDYISLPKPNLYQSLHTTVVAPKGKMVEFQIRTYEMHNRAER